MIEFPYTITHNKKAYNLSCTLIQGKNLDDLVIKAKDGSEIRVRFSSVVFPHTVLSKKLSYKVTYGAVKDVSLLDYFIWDIVAYIRDEYQGKKEGWVHPKNMK